MVSPSQPAAALELRTPERRRALAALDAMLAGTTPEQLARRPAPGKWSASEVLEHLAITYSSTARMLQKVARAAALEEHRASMRECLFTALVTGIGYFP